MSSPELLDRARLRCSHHRRTRGVCRKCFEAEFEEMLVEENPELCRGDAFELVQECLRVEDDPAH